METSQLRLFDEWFVGRVEQFRQADGSLAAMHQLKYDHSRRVERCCTELARDLGWSAAAICGATAVGLVHDVGRFTQFARFNSFHDRPNADHGHLGLVALREDAPLDQLSPDEARRIKVAVRLHNRRDLPLNLAPADGLWLRLVRDADKLDILYVLFDALRTDKLDDFPDLSWDPHQTGTPNPALVAALDRGVSASYADVRTLSDFFVLTLSWVHDFNFAPTLQRLRGEGLFDRIVPFMGAAPEIGAALTTAHRCLEHRLRALNS